MPQILINNLSFKLEDGKSLFSNLSFGLQKEKVGLIGDNGVGKTTLIKLINKELTPAAGNIFCDLSLAYLPQDYQLDSQKTIEEVLDISDKNIIITMKKLDIDNIDQSRTVGSLSGGEKMKVLLAKTLTSNPDFIILDEPTNNLDQESRELVYNLIKSWKKGLLVISHDRTLLNLVDKIIELTKNGIKSYGGNYDHYLKQKNIEEKALEKQLNSADQVYKKAKIQAQKTKEKQQKRMGHGKNDRKKIGMGGSMLDKMKDTSQTTSSRLLTRHEKIVAEKKNKFDGLKNQIAPENEIILDLSDTSVPAGKLIVKINNLSFSFDQKKIFNNFNFVLYGPARVAIAGKNGSGKTTLVKLILGEILPSAGEIKVGTDKLAYLSQNVDWMYPDKTLLENLTKFSKLNDSDAKEWLAKFLFYGLDVHKKIRELSGGEKVRAALACALSGNKPPQLLILDEPTNNLDIDSIEQVESALSNYQGALIVISHDSNFLKALKITDTIKL